MRLAFPWATALVAILLWLMSQNAEAQSQPGNLPLTGRGKSEQFLIYGGSDAFTAGAARANNLIALAPALTAISCERIKSATLAKLGAPDRWQGRISVLITPAQRLQAFDLAVVPYGESWQYRLQVPDRVQPRQFVQAIVRTLLLEMANRSARDRSTEVPYWLAEGLTDEIIASSGVDLVVDAPVAGRSLLPVAMHQRDIRGDQSLLQAHECLQSNVPLTVEELSWPTNGIDNPVFRASAQLLVRRLLEMKGGPDAMQRFIAGLPENFNWQTTFLRAFAVEFDSLRTLEKWWMLESARFTSRSRLQLNAESGAEVLTERWTVGESWHRLDEVLHAPVQIHANSNALPWRSTVQLQTAFEEWQPAALRALLTAKVRELDALQTRLNLSVVRLAGEYRLVLESYLIALDRSKSDTSRRVAPGVSVRALGRETARKLAALDARRREQEIAFRQSATGRVP